MWTHLMRCAPISAASSLAPRSGMAAAPTALAYGCFPSHGGQVLLPNHTAPLQKAECWDKSRHQASLPALPILSAFILRMA